MTYKNGVELIDCIFAVTAIGHENDAMKLATHRIAKLYENGEIGTRTYDRLSNYIFDKTALEKITRETA